MISKKMEKLLNDQFHMEMSSANQYLAISSYFEEMELDGFAHFFRLQAQEELGHAMKQFDYLHTVDGKIVMDNVPKPQNDFNSSLHAFEFTLEHERAVTQSINNLMKEALNENDFATQNFLQWFIGEQVEEEALVHNIIRKLKMIDGNSSALFLLNEELKRRKPEPEVQGGIGGGL